MALRLTRFALLFGVVLAMAVIIRTITTGAAPQLLRASRRRQLRRSNRSTGLNSGMCSEIQQADAHATETGLQELGRCWRQPGFPPGEVRRRCFG